MAADKTRPKLIVRKFSEEAIEKYLNDLDDIQYAYPETQPVLIQIDSPGGPVTGLNMLLDRLYSMPNPIVTYTSSKACSAGAFLLAIAGSPGMRYASPNANIHIHEAIGGAVGDIKDVEDRVKNFKMLNKNLMKQFAKSVGKKNANEVRQMISDNTKGHDLWMSSKKAKELNIIDEVCSISIVPHKSWDIVKK